MTNRKSKRLTKEQRQFVARTLDTIIETNGGFRVIPPLQASKIRMLLNSDDGFNLLMESNWCIAFRERRPAFMEFTTFVVLLYNYERLRNALAESQNEFEDGIFTGVEFKSEFSLRVIMKPEVVRRIFKSLHINTDPPPDPPSVAMAGAIIRRKRSSPDSLVPQGTSPGEAETLTDDQLHRIADLVKLMIETDGGFKVFPPREVTEDVAVLSAPDIAERLINTKWWLVFSSDREEVMTFPELVVFVHHLHVVTTAIAQGVPVPQPDGGTYVDLEIAASFNLGKLLQTEVVKWLLDKIKMEGV